MVTGAALATVNRLPVLLAARRHLRAARRRPGAAAAGVDPSPGRLGQRLLQAGLALLGPDQRPGAAVPAALAAMRVLTSPAETGAVTLALPQDVQAEAFDVPDGASSTSASGTSAAPRPDAGALARAAALIRASAAAADRRRRRRRSTARRPRRCARSSSAPASRSARRRRARARCRTTIRSNLGAIGATGTFAANRVAREADLVIGIGTRWTATSRPPRRRRSRIRTSRFVNVNVAELDAAKHGGLALRRRRARDARAAGRAALGGTGSTTRYRAARCGV